MIEMNIVYALPRGRMPLKEIVHDTFIPVVGVCVDNDDFAIGTLCRSENILQIPAEEHSAIKQRCDERDLRFFAFYHAGLFRIKDRSNAWHDKRCEHIFLAGRGRQRVE